MILFLFFVFISTPFIVNTKYSGSQRKELRTHHQRAPCYVVLRSYNQRYNTEHYSRKKAANSDNFFKFSIMYHNHFQDSKACAALVRG